MSGLGSGLGSGRGILDADMQTLGNWLRQATRWWLDELGAMVPRGLRARWQSRSALVEYDPASGAFWPLAATDGADAEPKPGAPVSVVLPAGLCLIRQIDRPLMSERDLAAMIDLESTRILPFGSGAMVLAGRIIAKDTATGRMQAQVAGLPLGAAKALGAALANAANPPASVLVARPNADAPLPVDLLPALRQAGLVPPADRTASALWLIVGFLFALNIGLLVWRDVAAVQAVENMVAEQQPALSASRRITARIHGVDRIAAATTTARKTSEPLAILARINAALPEGVWLQRLRWQGDMARLTGFRPARADVSGSLRRAGFGVVRYGDTVTTGPTPLGQPFEITIRLGKS